MSKELNRPRITGITLHISYPNGDNRTITIDPDRHEAIFWTDRAVNEIFAPFYDTVDRSVSRDEFIERFGEAALQAVPAKDRNAPEIRITPELIRAFWTIPAKDGQLRPYSGKTRTCINRP